MSRITYNPNIQSGWADVLRRLVQYGQYGQQPAELGLPGPAAAGGPVAPPAPEPAPRRSTSGGTSTPGTRRRRAQQPERPEPPGPGTMPRVVDPPRQPTPPAGGSATPLVPPGPGRWTGSQMWQDKRDPDARPVYMPGQSAVPARVGPPAVPAGAGAAAPMPPDRMGMAGAGGGPMNAPMPTPMPGSIGRGGGRIWDPASGQWILPLYDSQGRIVRDPRTGRPRPDPRVGGGMY